MDYWRNLYLWLRRLCHSFSLQGNGLNSPWASEHGSSWSCVALRKQQTFRLYSHILTECRTSKLCGTCSWPSAGGSPYMSLVLLKTDNTEQGKSQPQFMSLIQNLLRDPNERSNFFQDVFPGDFGPTYDKAIQTLMWLFLSRLEKLLPNKTLQQIASLLSDTSSILTDCMQTFSQAQDLKILLGTQQDLSQLKDIESYIVDTAILSALCLPHVERVVIVNDQAETEAAGELLETVCTEMEVESDNHEVFVEGSENSEECMQTQWFALDNDVKAEMDGDPAKDLKSSEMEPAQKCVAKQSGTLIIGEDGQVTVLGGVEKKPGRRGRKKKCPLDVDFHVQTKNSAKEKDPDFVLWERPVRTMFLCSAEQTLG
ncbi:hypothetical protein D4764_01G0015650 [Takifugu flavidus]|uniref:TERF1-interacting nuclear factor 2 N-terminal domain-containing protein n=1 Tax=Takifugu flavidus TaxID=433684 RepID=A0A5C6PTL1_9TELE|nr:hypothetical protein D4764_01G0015650 [Takifugu flavidus]